MAQLPFIKDDNQTLTLIQTKWRSLLNPLLAAPIVNGIQLSNISIIPGLNVINHLLSRTQVGWIVTDTTGPHNLSRTQPLNALTLTLASSVSITCGLWVY